MNGLTIVYAQLRGVGWHPVSALAELAAELLEATLVVVPADRTTRHLGRLAARLPRRHGRGTCLVIAPRPRQLISVLQAPALWRGYERVAGWVIDSFWHEHFPRGLGIRTHYDQLFVTDPDDLGHWSEKTGRPVSCLPWGTDLLRLGSGQPNRPVDVQRVGRQPAAWDDDRATRRMLQELGVTFAPRPPMRHSARENQAALLQAFSRAKFTLSFTNTASPGGYTHPTRQYLTARWTDALAAGAVVAGISPACGAARALLWPDATLELPSTDWTPDALRLLVDAVRNWTPEQAQRNHRLARARLDWRWRLEELCQKLGLQAPRLHAELRLLKSHGAGGPP